jgi:Na+-driven multidrug efflux pump
VAPSNKLSISQNTTTDLTMQGQVLNVIVFSWGALFSPLNILSFYYYEKKNLAELTSTYTDILFFAVMFYTSPANPVSCK